MGGVDDVDAVGDSPGAAQVLALDPGGVAAGLLLPGFIDHQHRLSWVTQADQRELPDRANTGRRPGPDYRDDAAESPVRAHICRSPRSVAISAPVS